MQDDLDLETLFPRESLESSAHDAFLSLYDQLEGDVLDLGDDDF